MTPPNLKASNLNDIPWLAHGFFGRKGGTSTGEFESLNVSLKKGDLLENVMQNRQRMANALSMENIPIVFACQKHTNTVLVIDRPFGDDVPTADALVTHQKNLIIGIQTADCVPVLFLDPFNKVIAAAHAGWKGLAGGILQNTLVAMESLGASRKHIKAAIGPCIWSESYEVGSDVHDAFPDSSDLFMHWRAPTKANGMGIIKTFGFDLPMAAYRTLQIAGIADINPSPINTYAHADDYFSYRRSTHLDEIRYGGQASLIGMPNI
ncbi:MAG: peptidoglycan editing factor PgeF [Pseudomonadota bacterium]